MSATNWMIYGCYGYTGKLIAEEAKRRGLRPTLAGRDAEKTKAVANSLDLPFQVFPLDLEAIKQNLAGFKAVLHCAGPFSATSRPMIEGCLAAHVSYLDITGEIEVLENAFFQNEQAKKAGISILPGVGFDVVPSDCLAKLLKDRLPLATSLELAFAADAKLSPGTAKSMVEGFAKGGKIRRDGKIQSIPIASISKTIPFSHGKRSCTAIPWGDVSTAFYSTQIPNITTYAQAPELMATFAKATQPIHILFGHPMVQKTVKRVVELAVKGPSESDRKRSQTHLWGQVTDGMGKTVSAWLDVNEGYDFTVTSSLEIMRRVLAGQAAPGTLTPSMAFGANLVEELGFPVHFM